MLTMKRSPVDVESIGLNKFDVVCLIALSRLWIDIAADE